MDAFSREIFARTLWMEARGEGTDGLRDVGHSINNRYASGKWFAKFNGKSSLALVCLFDQQYSSWNASRDDSNREQMAVLDDDDSDLAHCRSIVDAIAAGEADSVNGATHYFDARLPTWPAWADKATLTKISGHHRFYKDVP